MSKTLSGLLVAALMFTVLGVQAISTQQNAMSKQSDGTYVVNTSTLCKVKGYRSTTPLKIYIKNDKVEKIEALKNQETPKYFTRVKQEMLNKWNGKTVKKAVKLKVNGVTGATMSSDALKKNVKAGLEYYQTHK
ncbi:MAG: FMN-binding protein [Prevotella sp.]|nr:FMN-binding protein [Prevotella sp.]